MCAYMVGTERARVRFLRAYITRSNVSSMTPSVFARTYKRKLEPLQHNFNVIHVT